MKRIITIILLMICCLGLSSCSSFFSAPEEEIISIKSIDHELLLDGRTKITIKYTSEDKEDDVFFIQQGIQGNDGVGINNITYEELLDGSGTEVSISFTNSNMDPVKFLVKNGLHVTGIETSENKDTKEHFIIFNYNDGTSSEPILLPAGPAGNGISKYEVVNNDDGSINITFEFVDSVLTPPVTITIPAPIEGNGIDSIIGTEEGNEYVLYFTFTKGEPQRVAFSKPADPNKWIAGEKAPTIEDGADGDFYYDKFHKVIYYKEANVGWIVVYSFDTLTQNYTVTFDLNDSADAHAYMPTGCPTTFVVGRGQYFISDGNPSIPIPTRNGYQFVGWYTQKYITPTSGAFTELTPVFSNLTLYAIWEEIK